MRWGYLVPRGVIVFVFWTFFAFAFDPLFRWGLVGALQHVTGAKADVATLQTSFFPSSVSLGNVQLADPDEPMTNLIEFDQLQFQLESDPLMQRKFVIEKGTLTGLHWGTPRTESGLLEERPEPEPQPNGLANRYLDGLGEKADELGKNWIDELTERTRLQVNPNQFESVRLADDLQQRWGEKFKSLEIRIKTLEAGVKTIEKSVKNVKGNTLERIETYNRARLDANAFLAEADWIRRELPELGKRAGEDYQQLDAARLRDLQAIRQKIDLLKLDAQSLSEALIGPKIRQQLATTIDWIRWARHKIEVATARPEPERMRGLAIDFSHGDVLPTVLVRSLKIAGQANLGEELMPFQGTVTGLTSDPVLYGKPIVIQLVGRKTAILQVEVVVDHTHEIPVYDVDLAYSVPIKTETKLGKSDSLLLALAADKTEWRAKLRLSGDELSGELHFRQAPVTIAASMGDENREEVRRALENALGAIHIVEATASLSGRYDRPTWQVQSNLGQQISAGLSTALTQEVEIKRQQLAGQVDRLAQEKMTEFTKLVNDKYTDVVAQLNLNETNARQIVQRLASRNGLGTKDLNKTLNFGKKLDIDEKKIDLNRLLRRR